MRMMFALLGLTVLGAAFVLNTPTTLLAADPTPVGPATGTDDDGNPNEATTVEGEVGAPTPIVCVDIKNATDKSWTDIHLENVRYKNVHGNWRDGEFNTNYNSGDGILIATIDGGAGSGMGALPASDSEIGGSTKEAGGGGGTLAEGKSLKVCFKPQTAGGASLPEDTEVEVDVVGTEGATQQEPAGATVSATGVNEIGDGTPRTSVASLGIPNFDADSASGSASGGTLMLNDIALAETCGYRFNSGSLVIKPNRSTRFVLDPEETEVLIYDENGNEAGGGVAGAGDLHINDADALVMDILRDQTDDLHVVIVIRGLVLEEFGHLESGDTVTAGAYGEAIPANGILDDNWTIAEFDVS